MTKRDAMRLNQQENTLISLGFTREEAEKLRRISMTLHAWHERECGNGYGCIERDETTGKPFWTSVSGPERQSWPIADLEKGALKRLAAIMAERDKRVAANRLPAPLTLTSYIQTDPRGAALYILRPGDVPEGASVNSYYTRGICILLIRESLMTIPDTYWRNWDRGLAIVAVLTLLGVLFILTR